MFLLTPYYNALAPLISSSIHLIFFVFFKRSLEMDELPSLGRPVFAMIVGNGIFILPSFDSFIVSVHRAPHLLRYRALEVPIVRLRARSLAYAAPCKRLPCWAFEFFERFNPVNRYQI